MNLNTDLICECGHKWQEELDYQVERRWEVIGVDGLFANAVTTCPECEYKGVARGIIPANDRHPKFYLKQENSLYFPRGGRKPSPNEQPLEVLNPSNQLNIHLYREPAARTLETEQIARYLRRKLENVVVDVRAPFFNNGDSLTDEFKKEMAKARIYDFSDPDFEPRTAESAEPLISEEVVYDGFELLSPSQQLLKEDELSIRHIHLVFTNCFFGTWDSDDHRYHLRLSSLGFSKLISTTGIIEAPARPSAYYRARRENGESSSEERMSSEFLSYDDSRLTEILKGISMQAIFYHLTGEPFCVDPGCRLFNGHWQEEVVNAQLNEPEFCSSHQELLDKINNQRRESQPSN